MSNASPTRGHTYYVARLDRVLGFLASDEELAAALRAVWLGRSELAGRESGEPAPHEGVSAWVDAATETVQVRAVLFDPETDRYSVIPIEAAPVAKAMLRAERSQ